MGIAQDQPSSKTAGFCRDGAKYEENGWFSLNTPECGLQIAVGLMQVAPTPLLNDRHRVMYFLDLPADL